MENFFWFKHRFNLSRDSRLYKLIDEEGARGYGSYLFILERLYNQESGRLFIGQLKLIQQKGFPQAYLEKIVRNYGLFVIEDDMFSSAIDYSGTSRKEAEVSKKNTAEEGAEEEEAMTDRMKVAEETAPVVEEASPFVEEDGDFRAATSPAAAAEVSEACAATPDELVADCLPTACRLAVGKQSGKRQKAG
ncbi:Lin1244/Lin1753 domain-containing protein [Bacteroides heparinolyticus]|uniref:Lin1244/Lin1753 domain-containing protein n=1 Tax=Prevotella heparinolytica TaxID=28113 RepID=UPI0028E5CB44|nr:Lin1244/Lin1753 domain-containing protein [Bacteroides heparinolyticus]